jgi:arylsulfatase A-like enzyme
MHEESFQLPFLILYPLGIAGGVTCENMCCNVDFAPTFLDYAGLTIPSYMRGSSLKPLSLGKTPDNWKELAYHHY